MRTLLDRVCVEAVLVIHDSVVRRPYVALKTIVCLSWTSSVTVEQKTGRRPYLEIPVKVVDVCDALVDDGSRNRVAIARCVLSVGWPEPRVVAFATDDDRETWLIRSLRGDLPERRL